jgi:hypothetical protein
VLSAVCGFVSRCLPIGSTSPLVLVPSLLILILTQIGSHWLAIHFQSRFHSYYFDSYSLPPYIPSIQFIRHNCSVWDYNTVQLQGPTSTVWANTAVSSPCTWTEVIHQKNSSVFLLQRPSTRLFGTCSRRNFGLYEIYLEEGSAAAVEIKRK